MILIAGCVKEVEFNELISNPQDYTGKKICTSGIHVFGFEASALGESTYQKEDVVYLNKPTIWIETRKIVESKENCFKNFSFEFCRVSVCGVFEYGGKYGHLSGYKYQIKRI